MAERGREEERLNEVDKDNDEMLKCVISLRLNGAACSRRME